MKTYVAQIKSKIPEFITEETGERIEIVNHQSKIRVYFSKGDFKNGRDGYLDMSFIFY